MNLNTLEHQISDTGDSSVLMGVVIVTALYFFICKDNREAVAILSSLAVASALIAILKIIFLGCGHGYLSIRSPSGHSALSIAVYGTFPLLIAPRVGKRMRMFIFSVFYALALAIVYTRVSLHMHSFNEALLGLGVGAITILLVKFFAIDGRTLGAKIAPHFNVYFLLALTIGVIAVLHGMNFPAEKMIHSAAGLIKSSGVCPS